MFRRVALVRTEDSEERSSPILVTLLMEAVSSFETSVLRRVARRLITEDCIPHSHRHEYLKAYIAFINWLDSVAEM
jgi:hypothetical protein